jgi:parallel beta-helix repeat protein
MATTTSSVKGVAVVLVVALVASAGATAAIGSNSPTTEMNKLSSCGTIDTPGKYLLTEDIDDAPADGCFAVDADHVSIYGLGHSVATENGTGAAVAASGVDDVFVSNVVASGWETGVALHGVEDGVVTGNEFRNVSGVGVSLRDGTSGVSVDQNLVVDGTGGVHLTTTDAGNDVTDNRFTNLTGTAVEVTVLSSDTEVADNVVHNVTGHGIYVADSQSVTITGNDVDGSAGGIEIQDGSGVTIHSNHVRDTDSNGIVLDGEVASTQAEVEPMTATEQRHFEALQMLAPGVDTDTDSSVVNNTVAAAGSRGIVVNETRSVTVTGNVVNDTKDGLYVHASIDTSVTDNQVDASRDDGIQIAEARNSTVSSNDVTASQDDGVYAVGPDNAVLNNSVTENGDDGVDLQNATRATVRGNAFVNNADDGVYLRDTDNATVVANEVRSNGNDGIDLRSSSWNVVENNEVCMNADAVVRQRHAATQNEVKNNGC